MAYKTPGVFVEEITTLAPSVVAVETAIPAFIGYTQTATDDGGNNLTLVPTRIKSQLEYQAFFGGDFVPASYQVELDTTAGNAFGAATPRNAAGNERRYHLFNCIRHYYANGGGPCYIVSVGSYADEPARGTVTTGLLGGLISVAPVDEPTLLVFPDGVSLSDIDMGALQTAALAQCELLQDRFVIMDLCQGDQPVSLSLNPISNFRQSVGTSNLKYGAAYYPWVRTIYAPEVHFRQLRLVTPRPALNLISDADINNLTGDAVLDALVPAVRTADVTVGTVVAAINVSGMANPGALILSRSNFAQLPDQFAMLLDRLRQSPASASDADVRQRFGNLLILARAIALGLRTLERMTESVQSIASITRSSSTATVTTATAHGFTTGQPVVIAGANQAEYNGTFTITVTGASAFTYPVTGTPATPATGMIAATAVLPATVQSVSGITRSGSTATVITASAHGLTTGQPVVIAGANEAEYNGTFTITVTGASAFTYPVTGTPATPATGTITATVGLPATVQSVSGITRSGSTATVTTASAHGLTTGQPMVIAGANEAEYNGTFTITVTGASSFTYPVTGTPATPATGTITATVGLPATVQSVSGITRSGSTATVTTATAHGFTTGQPVVIAGANQAGYNGTFTITVTGASAFTYPVTGTPATPATGTITATAGLPATVQSVSGITWSGSTATVTTASAHGLTTGQPVVIAGANQAEYNGTFTITVTGASAFTYPVTGTPATPATGTITATVGLPATVQSVSGITRSGSTATVTTASAHGLTTGQPVVIAGANQAEYNGIFTITVTGASAFTYPVTGTPATPATGTITASLGLPATLTLAITDLRADLDLRATITGLVGYEKNAGVMSAVSATRGVADVATDYASLDGSNWILPSATVGAIVANADVFTGANLRETALNAAIALRSFVDPLAAAMLSLFFAADFLAGEAEKQLFAQHPVFGDIVSEVTRTMVVLPPSGAVAGVYAAVDRTRGVWKAPANVSLADVSGVAVKINDHGQEDLNVTTTGKSVNAIRAFAGKGCLVWGARTLAGNDNEWRYVPVRRFFNMAEESIRKATEPFVFEPNDRGTWVRVRAMIENFLTVQWRQGALAGSVPQQAFFVKVGLGETMTSQDILEGRMIVEVGMAVVRPAEFIILRFAHKMQTS